MAKLENKFEVFNHFIDHFAKIVHNHYFGPFSTFGIHHLCEKNW